MSLGQRLRVAQSGNLGDGRSRRASCVRHYRASARVADERNQAEIRRPLTEEEKRATFELARLGLNVQNWRQPHHNQRLKTESGISGLNLISEQFFIGDELT